MCFCLLLQVGWDQGEVVYDESQVHHVATPYGAVGVVQDEGGSHVEVEEVLYHSHQGDEAASLCTILLLLLFPLEEVEEGDQTLVEVAP